MTESTSNDLHSKLLSLNSYERYEPGHPGFLKDILTIMREMKTLRNKPRENGDTFTILEMGAGPGNLLTKKLGEEFADKGAKVYVNESDPKTLRVLQARQQEGVLSENLIVQEEAQGVTEWMQAHDNLKFDAIVSNGVMHHMRPQELEEFYLQAQKSLKPGGKLIMGEEHLDYTLPPNMLALMGLNAPQIKAFTKLSALADRIVSKYPGDDGEQLKKDYAHQLEDKTARAALVELGILEKISPLELRKHLRPAVTVAHHVGYVMRTTWKQGKIKLPALEFMALASNLSTCEGFFREMHDNEPADCKKKGYYNDIAVHLLDKIAHEMDRQEKCFMSDRVNENRAWEAVEPGATQDGRIDAHDSRNAVMAALYDLCKSLNESHVAGIPLRTLVINPDIRIRRNGTDAEVRKGGINTYIPVPPSDMKMTPMELANIAAMHGFVTTLKRNEGNGFTRQTAYCPELSSVGDDGAITFGEPQLGGMTVTVAERASEVQRARERA